MIGSSTYALDASKEPEIHTTNEIRIPVTDKCSYHPECEMILIKQCVFSCHVESDVECTLHSLSITLVDTTEGHGFSNSTRLLTIQRH